jgi:hypothetical protein
MALVAVVDAQFKSRVSITDVIKRSPWWKKLSS